jgi:PmbA protein
MRDEPAADGPVKHGKLRGRLERRAPGRWELYFKSADSWELVSSQDLARTSWRREEGWAARFWENGGPRFAAGSSPGELLAALDDAERFAVSEEPPPEWPSGTAELPPEEVIERPPDLFGELSQAVAAASRGECRLARLALRRGAVAERIANGAGLDVGQRQTAFDGVATAIGRRASRAREIRLPFHGSEAPAIEPLARRLCDAATLPLSERSASLSRGQWLLDPAVGAALLAALSPIFTSERPPRWIAHGSLAGREVSIADDASGDAPFDGEGVPTRRVLLVEAGQLTGGLYDLRSARRAGRPSTGHGVRSSFRTPPCAGPRRIFFETSAPRLPAELLASVTRGLYASALTAPVRVDLAEDRYEIEFTGIAVVAGRARGPVPGARASGRLSELLRRVRGLSSDLQFFPLPFAAGAPTMLVERTRFE